MESGGKYMNKTLRTSVNCKIRLYKILDFDVLFYVLPRQEVLFDNEVHLIPPNYDDYDVSIYVLRQSENIDDPMHLKKQDGDSFFEYYEKKGSLNYPGYMSADVRAIENVGKRRGKPIGYYNEVVGNSKPESPIYSDGKFVPVSIKDVGKELRVCNYVEGVGFFAYTTTNFESFDTLENYIPIRSVKEILRSVNKIPNYISDIDDYLITIHTCLFHNLYDYDVSFSRATIGKEVYIEILVDDGVVYRYQYDELNETSTEDSLEFMLYKGVHSVVIKRVVKKSTVISDIYVHLDEDYYPVSVDGLTKFKIYESVDYSEYITPEITSVDVDMFQFVVGKYVPVVALYNTEGYYDFSNYYLEYPSHVEMIGATSYKEGSFFDILNNFDTSGSKYFHITCDLNFIVKLRYDRRIKVCGILILDGIPDGSPCSYLSVYPPVEVDDNLSRNVDTHYYNTETNWYDIRKVDRYDHLVVMFKQPLDTDKLDLLIHCGKEWTAKGLVVLVKDINYQLYTDTGEFVDIEPNMRLTQIPFQEISVIPTIYPKDLSKDIVYGTTFIMYALDNVSNDFDIEILGYSFKLYSQDVPTTRHILSLPENIGYFHIYRDGLKHFPVNWNYLLYNNGVIETSTEFIIEVTIKAPRQGVVIVKVPNIGLPYTCPSHKVKGYNQYTDTFVDNIENWKSKTLIGIKVDEGESTVILTPGEFTPDLEEEWTSHMILPDATYDYNKYCFAILTEETTIPEGSYTYMYMFKQDSPPSLSPIDASYDNIVLMEAVLTTMNPTGGEHEVLIDLKGFRYVFPDIPLKVIDARTRNEVTTGYVNKDNSIVSKYCQFDGDYLIVNCYVPLEGTKLLICPGPSSYLPYDFEFDDIYNLRQSLIYVAFTGQVVDMSGNNFDIESDKVVCVDVTEAGGLQGVGELNSESYIKIPYIDADYTTISFHFCSFMETYDLIKLGNRFKLYVDNGRLLFYKDDDILINFNVIIDKGQWHHIVLMIDKLKASITLYFDREKIGTYSVDLSELHIYYFEFSNYVGWLEDIRVYNRPLDSFPVPYSKLTFPLENVPCKYFWPLEGNTVDLINKVVGRWEGNISYGPGLVSGCAEFDGESGIIIDLEHNLQVPFTFTCWVNVEGVGGDSDQVIIGWDDASTLASTTFDFAIIGSNYGRTWRLKVGCNGGDYLTESGDNISYNTWMFVVAEFDYNHIKLKIYDTFKNILLNKGKTISLSAVSSTKFAIGSCLTSSGQLSNHFKGQINRVRIFHDILEEDEILHLLEIDSTLPGMTKLAIGQGIPVERKQPLSDNSCVLYYNFNKQVLDAIQNNDGIWYGNEQYDSGFSGPTAKFDGMSYIKVFNKPITDQYLVSNFSVSLWIKPDNNPGVDQYIFSFGIWIADDNSDNYAGFGLRYDGDKTFSIIVLTRLDVHIYENSITVDKDNLHEDWTYVVVTYDYTMRRVKLYIDGEFKCQVDFAGYRSVIPMIETVIGAGKGYKDGNEVFDYYRGMVDEFRIFSKVLTDDEVNYLYEAFTQLTDPDDPFNDNTCIAYYPFNENVQDNKGNYNGIWHGRENYIEDSFGYACAPTKAYQDYISIPDIISDEWTISFWVKSLVDFSYYQPVMGCNYEDDTNYDWFVGIYDNHIAVIDTPISPINMNEFCHVVIVYRGGDSFTVYVSGELKGSFVVNGNNLNRINQIGGFKQFDNDHTRPCIFDNLRVFNRQLSSREITALYNFDLKSKEVESPTDNVTDYDIDPFNDGSCISYFPLDNIVLDVAGQHNGVWIGNEQYDVGKSEYGALFDGNTYIRTSLDKFTSPDVTVCFWIKQPPIQGGYNVTKTIFHFSDSGRNTFVLYQYADPHKMCIVMDGNVVGILPDPLDDNNWHHLAVTSTGKVFVDGQLVIDNMPSVDMTKVDRDFLIGADWDSSAINDFVQEGTIIDEVYVFNRELTELRVNIIRNKHLNADTSHLLDYLNVDPFEDHSCILYYPFDYNLYDRANGYHAKWIGTGKFVRGVSKQAVEFKEKGYIKVGLDSFPSSDMTISFLLKQPIIHMTGENHVILDLAGDTNHVLTLYQYNHQTGKMGFYVDDQFVSSLPDPLEDSHWHHVVIDSQGNVYVDNNKVLELGDIDISQVSKNILLGASYIDNDVGNYSQSGLCLDEFYVFNRLLIEEEVNHLYEMYKDVIESGELQTVSKLEELLTTLFDNPKLKYDTSTLVKLYFPDSTAVPYQEITNLIDIKSVQAEPILIYKYISEYSPLIVEYL